MPVGPQRKNLNKHSIRDAQGEQRLHKTGKNDPGRMVTVNKWRMIERGGGRGNVTMVHVTDEAGEASEVPVRQLYEKD